MFDNPLYDQIFFKTISFSLMGLFGILVLICVQFAVEDVAVYYLYHQVDIATGIMFLFVFFFFLGLALLNYLSLVLKNPGYMQDYKDFMVNDRDTIANQDDDEHKALKSEDNVANHDPNDNNNNDINANDIPEQEPVQSSSVAPPNDDASILLPQRYNDIIETAKTCKKCQLPKPKNTHHCSICNKCVAYMNHHCPWVNNCIGYRNQRFFLMFIFYLFWASFILTCFSLPLFFNNHSIGSSSKFVKVMGKCVSMATTIIMLVYNLIFWYSSFKFSHFYHMYLAFYDKSLMDFIKQKPTIEKPLTFETFQEFLVKIFGTKDYLYIILPSAESNQNYPFQKQD